MSNRWVYAIAGLVALSGCSDGALLSEDGSVRQEMDVDVSGVACLFGTDAVQVSSRAAVGSNLRSNGYVEVQAGSEATKTSVDGDIEAGDWVRVGGAGSDVSGGVTAGSWIDVQSGAVVHGPVQPNANVAPVLLGSQTVASGSENVYVQSPSNCDVALDPGAYGDIYVNQGCSLELAAGRYDVGRLVVHAEGTLRINGSVEVNAQWEFSFGDRATLLGANDPDDLEVYSNQAVRIGTDTEFRGMVVAPNGEATVGNRSSFTGCMRARRTVLNTDVTFARQLDPGPEHPATVVGNATIGVEWDPVDGATGYNLYWTIDPAASPLDGNVIPNVERGYVHEGLTNGVDYFYAVTAITDSGETAASDVVSGIPGGEWVLRQLGTGDFDDVVTGARVPKVDVEDRIHILLYGEGYQAAELPQLDVDVDAWTQTFNDLEPYSLFPEAFVIWYIPRASNTHVDDPAPDTAFAITASSGLDSFPVDGETAQRAWDAIHVHPYPPTDFSGPVRFSSAGDPSARNFVGAFLVYHPGHGHAGVYGGFRKTLENPSNPNEVLSGCVGANQIHEFTHAFSWFRDEYIELNNGAPHTTNGLDNVVDTNVCSDLPWAHLLHGTAINPSTPGLVGAFGTPAQGYHSELLCLMNGGHDNGTHYGDGGACSAASCSLRTSDRMCNFCRETTTLRIFQRAGLLDADESGYDDWVADYRSQFYARYQFQIPGVHYPGLLPQSNDLGNPAAGTQIYEACVP